MTKRSRLTKSQEAIKQRVLNAYRKPYGFLYVPIEWDKKLWKKSTSDIYEFIEDRFRNTMDVTEYYSAMIFLWKTMPNAEILVEFHDSPQWIETARTYHIDRKQTTNGNEHEPTETSRNEQTTLNLVEATPFVGGMK